MNLALNYTLYSYKPDAWQVLKNIFYLHNLKRRPHRAFTYDFKFVIYRTSLFVYVMVYIYMKQLSKTYYGSFWPKYYFMSLNVSRDKWLQQGGKLLKKNVTNNFFFAFIGVKTGKLILSKCRWTSLPLRQYMLSGSVSAYFSCRRISLPKFPTC